MKNIEHLVIRSRQPYIIYNPRPIIYTNRPAVVYYDNYHRTSMFTFLIIFIIIIILSSIYFAPVVVI